MLVHTTPDIGCAPTAPDILDELWVVEMALQQPATDMDNIPTKKEEM